MRTVSYPTDCHGWSELLPERIVTGAVPKLNRVPWVVVGAGVTGLACARRLAELRPDDEIVLLEARMVGQGASGRNSGYAVAVSQPGGVFNPAQKTEYQRINRINCAGLELLRSQVHDNEIDCQWADSGFHHVAVDTKAQREHDYFARYLDELEIEHQILGSDELASQLGTRIYQKGIKVPVGALVQPAALVRGLADTLPENVSLYEQCPVQGLEPGDEVKIVLGETEFVADKVILATNYEAGKLNVLGQYLIGSTLSGSFTRILEPEEFATLGELKQWGALSLHSGGATVRLTEDRRICLRNTAEYHRGALLNERELTERQSIHREAFERRFPQLAHVPFEFAWSGVEGISRNFTNFFGEQQKNVYFAGGYNGSGVSRGTAFGTAMAEYLNGGQSELISDCLGSKPGSWIPPRPLLDIGAFFTVRSRFRGVGLDR